MTKRKKIIGLFPAGGKATRLGTISGSKEIIPVPTKNNNTVPVGQFLVNAYEAAQIDEIIIILREGKMDIQNYFNATKHQRKIRYLNLQRSWGTPFTLDDAWPYTRDHIIALGFPDIILQPENVFEQLLLKSAQTNADVVLGLFKTHRPQNADMVRFDNTGRVIELDIKPVSSDLQLTWVSAIWQPSFTRFMHEFLKKEEVLFRQNPQRREPYVGTVFNAAIDEGLTIESHTIENGEYIDIGTPEDLARAQSGWLFD